MLLLVRLKQEDLLSSEVEDQSGQQCNPVSKNKLNYSITKMDEVFKNKKTLLSATYLLTELNCTKARRIGNKLNPLLL